VLQVVPTAVIGKLQRSTIEVIQCTLKAVCCNSDTKQNSTLGEARHMVSSAQYANVDINAG
jgi:hypothetical protein